MPHSALPSLSASVPRLERGTLAGPLVSILIALADAEQAEEMAHVLSEEHDFAVQLAADLEDIEPVDLVITDGAIVVPDVPHLLVGRGVAGIGVAGVLPLLADPQLVAAAARLAVAGYRLVGPVPDEFADGEKGAALPLTQRERQTLALLADGASNKLIARRLDISVHTAKFHVAAVLAKLNASNRADAVAIGVRQGLLLL